MISCKGLGHLRRGLDAKSIGESVKNEVKRSNQKMRGLLVTRAVGGEKRVEIGRWREYGVRAKKYVAKYEEREEKKAIEPSRVLLKGNLDPSKERKLGSHSLRSLAYDADELGSAAFDAFDVDLSSRDLDPEAMSDEELEKVIAAQESHENLLFASPPTFDNPSSSPHAPSSPLHKSRPSIAKEVASGMIKSQTKKASTKLSLEPLQVEASESESMKRPELVYRKAVVAIVGRPNVGKSTIFNRLIRKSKSLITPKAGTTRDRKYGYATWEAYEMMFVDTGGLLGDDEEMETVYEAGSSEAKEVVTNWKESIREQAEVAIEESDMIVFVTDYEKGEEPLNPHDLILARMLRKTSKPVLMVVNKCDNEERMEEVEEKKKYERLGLGEVFPVSASHGIGIEEMLDGLVRPLGGLGFAKKEEREDGGLDGVAKYALTEDRQVLSGAFHEDGSRKEIRVALVGVPNVGKSSLLNQILGKKRSVVSATPGTTTDPVDEKIMWKGMYPITMVDTAGVRKKKAQEGFVEKLSALWSLKVIESSHVSVLLIDAENGVQSQDVRLSSYIMDNYRSCLVVINKWDLAPDRSIMGMQAYEEQLRERLSFWYYVPVVFASAKSGFNTDAILAWIIRISDERRIHLTTRKLFQILQQAAIVKPPPKKASKSTKFRFATQVNLGGGPTFIFFVTHLPLINPPYKRFLEGFIRQNYAFTGTPIRLLFRQNASRKFQDKL